ncbi:MAG: hypothetical protein LBS89_03540 [Zoogloeaceae bacterium]|jgi:hypothetical protein|nr:hypothetical protein [Zoogloeaceae bacterium]
MKLIPDWRLAWRFSSIWLAAATALLSTAYDYLPAIREAIPDGWVKWAAIAIIAARIVHQRRPENAQ